jgi:hypothetical protein
MLRYDKLQFDDWSTAAKGAVLMCTYSYFKYKKRY